MAHRDGLAVDAAGGDGLAFLGGEVGDDLVAVEVEIDPVLARAALSTGKARWKRGRVWDGGAGWVMVMPFSTGFIARA